MRRSLTLAALAALTLATPALAGTWTFDPAHSSARFTVRHMMVSDVSGTLGPISGSVELDDKDVTKSKISLTIDVAPDTRNQKRDDHLKSPDFFDAAKFPRATFTSTKIVKAGKKLKVTGDLTMKDVTKPVTLELALTPEVVNPFSKQPTRGGTATGTLNREDWGLTWNMPMANSGLLVGKDVKLEVVAELSPAAPDAKP